MPVAKLTCPKCKAVLKPAKPLPPGKPVKCPKCSKVFKVPEEEISDVVAAVSEEPPQPAPSTRNLTDEEEDTGPATYQFADEPAPRKPSKYDEDDDDFDDEKYDLSIVPDLTVKDPRGIAQEQIIRPSNWLMFMAVFDIVLILIWMGWILIPIFFSLPPDTDAKSNQPVAAQSKETATKSSYEAPNFGLANWVTVLVTFAVGAFCLAYNGFIVMGAVRMQNLESYGICIAACILAMLPIAEPCCYLMRLLFGVICLVTLKNPVVVAGFNYRTDHPD
jgi:hypothetical protein